MALLDSLLNAGQTPWAQAQQSDWQNPGQGMSQLPVDQIMKLLGMGGGQVAGGPQAPVPAAPQPVQRTPLPPPAMEPTANGIAQIKPQGGSGVLQQYGAGASYQPGVGSEVKVSDAPMPAPSLPVVAKAPIPTAPAAPVAKRPDFTIQPQGSDYLGAVLKGAGGMLGPLGDLVGGQSGRTRAAQSHNMTYDWLMRNGTSPQDAEFITRNPDVMKAVLESKFGAKGLTDDLKEYQYDVAQLKLRGEKDIPTYGVWKTNLKKAGSTQVTVDQRPQSAFDTAIAKDEAERYNKLVNGGNAARDTIANLDVVGQALDVYNRGAALGTGALGKYESTLRGYGAALGIGNAETVGAAELVESITNRMALLMRNPDSGMGMPGAMSDADRNFLKSAQPGIDKTPAGNARMIEVMKRIEGRKQQIGEMATDWLEKHGNMKGFQKHVNDFAKSNNLFADFFNTPTQQRAGPDGAASFAAPAVAGSMPRVQSDAEYNALPSGSMFTGPDGKQRRKP